MTNYENVLKNLTAYRKTSGLTQNELASKIGISQEMYSYIENGRVIISGELLLKLSALGLDIDMLIAGKTYDYNALDLKTAINHTALGTLPTAAEKDFILKLLAEIILNHFRKNTSPMTDNILLLEALCLSWDNFSMLRFVRSKLNLNQADMAELLGLGIKKYRALERENIYPDAEMLIFLYRLSGYQPSLFMNLSSRKLKIISSTWENLSPERKDAFAECLTALNKCIAVKMQ